MSSPDDNPYIYHPKAQRAAFVTPRSLEAASDWMKQRANFDDHTLTSLLMGTIGERGAMDLMAFVKLADQLPSMQSIKDDPMGAHPDSRRGVHEPSYRTLANLSAEWIDAGWSTCNVLDSEAQGMFANGVRNPKYKNHKLVMTNKKFTEWAGHNNYMFAADRK